MHSFYFLIALVVFEGSLALGTGDRIPTSLSFEMQYTAHAPFPDNIDEMSGYCARLLADKQKITLRNVGVIFGVYPEATLREAGEVKRLSQKKNVSVHAATSVTPENIGELFTHEYSTGKFGAKALVFTSDESVLNSVFWQTGEGSQAREVHHRDVMAAMLRAEAQQFEEDAEVCETIGNHFLQRVGGPPFQKVADEIHFGFAEGLFNLTRDRKAAAEKLRFQAVQVSDVRTHLSIPSDKIFSSQGFQFTAEIQKDGKLRIVSFDVDSSVTSAQIGSGQVVDAGDLSRYISIIHSAIDPRIRSYHSIRISRLKEFKMSGELVLPEGLKLVSLPTP